MKKILRLASSVLGDFGFLNKKLKHIGVLATVDKTGVTIAHNFRWLSMLCLGLFSLQLYAQENCSTAQYLGAVSGTYSGTTAGAANDISTCRTGSPDKVFYFSVANGYTIDIWEPSNGYDEYEYVGYGATCPGTQIQCWDNDGLAHTVWTNNTGSTQNVWWIQDGYSNSSGTFNLQWTITAPPDDCAIFRK